MVVLDEKTFEAFVSSVSMELTENSLKLRVPNSLIHLIFLRDKGRN